MFLWGGPAESVIDHDLQSGEEFLLLDEVGVVQAALPLMPGENISGQLLRMGANPRPGDVEAEIRPLADQREAGPLGRVRTSMPGSVREILPVTGAADSIVASFSR